MNDRFYVRYFNKNTKEFEYYKIGTINTNPYTDCTIYEEGQFCTGLHDKNGKLIYEGDIVRINGWWDACGPAGYDNNLCVVEFDESVCGFTPMCNYDCDCGVYHDAEDCEVIGNIYVNKELLEECE